MSGEMCDEVMQMVLEPLEEVSTKSDGSSSLGKQERVILEHFKSMDEVSSLSDIRKRYTIYILAVVMLS